MSWVIAFNIIDTCIYCLFYSICKCIGLCACFCILYLSCGLLSWKGFAKCHIAGDAGLSCISVWACICKSLCTNVHMCCWLTVGGEDVFFLPAYPVRLADSTASWWNELNSLLPNVNTLWHYANTQSDNSSSTSSWSISCIKPAAENDLLCLF